MKTESLVTLFLVWMMKQRVIQPLYMIAKITTHMRGYPFEILTTVSELENNTHP